MNDFSFRRAAFHRILDADDNAPPNDELDTLLRAWHQEHADIAVRDRDRILASVRDDVHEQSLGYEFRRVLTGRVARIAACIAIVAAIATVLFTPSRKPAMACDFLNVAEGGELTAFDKAGDRLGPCPLQHTDVDAEVTGPFTHVTLTQRYTNPYPQKIEAVYTFPMSHRSAVDRMRIIVKGPTGERIVEGEVKEREAARRIYEAARASGYVASLLEQERPNIFTQHVANIEPGSTIIVEIGYLETLERKDGVYTFDFPMTVAPRYVPGTPQTGGPHLPEGLQPRAGLVLLGPAQIEITTPGSTLSSQAAQQFLAVGRPIRMPTAEWQERNSSAIGPTTEFVATYANGAKETGVIYAGGSGHINGRWFWYGAPGEGNSGGGFAENTDQVPDASRLTPMPVKPPERAGHDVSVRVTIDSGGAALRDVNSSLHEITTEADREHDNRTVVTLKQKNAIPNRDFVVSWKSDANLISPGVYATMRQAEDATKGGYFAVILDPPARVEEKDVPARELIFVLDTSGSMTGFPIEKAKEVMTKAIAAMRPQDTFNVITFAGSTNILWTEARSGNDENKLIARRFVEEKQGGGGTEMMTAINAALKPLDRAGWLKPKELADLPADGRAVRVAAPMTALDGDLLDLGDGKSIRVTLGVSIPTVLERDKETLSLEGKWLTKDGDRVFAIDRASFERTTIAPTRIVMFLTDGLVGNEGAIMQAVHDNAKTTRVFSFGIGQSVNRSLLAGIAAEGRGACDIVMLGDDGDKAVERFVRRIQSPVLVDIQAKFDGVEVTDVLPDPAKIPDLFDEKPVFLFGRYAKPGNGTLTLKGTTGAGAWEQTMKLALPESNKADRAVPTLWARAKVESVMEPHRAAIEQQRVDAATKQAIVALGESYQIMTPYTSFVAVEKTRVTIGGNPVLVQVPIELPEGTSWKGFFGEGVTPAKWLALQPVRAPEVRYGGSGAGGAGDAGESTRVMALQSIEQVVTQDQANSQHIFFAASIEPLADATLSALGGSELRAAEGSDLRSAGRGAVVAGEIVSNERRGTDINDGATVVPLLGEIPAVDAVAKTGGDSEGHAISLGFQGTRGASKGPGGPTGASGPSKRPLSPVYRYDPSAAPAPAATGTPPPAPKQDVAPPAPSEPPQSSDAPRDRAFKENAKVREAEALDKAGATSAKVAERRRVEQPPPSTPGQPVDANKALEKKAESTNIFGEPSDTKDVDEQAATEESLAKRKQPTTKTATTADELKQVQNDVKAGVSRTPKAYTPEERDLLARHLERTLLALALAAEIDAKAALELAKTIQPALSIDDDGAVRVTILLSANRETMVVMLQALRENGIDVDASDTAASIIIARVKLEQLTSLALRDGVRRIEPFRPKPAAAQASQTDSKAEVFPGK